MDQLYVIPGRNKSLPFRLGAVLLNLLGFVLLLGILTVILALPMGFLMDPAQLQALDGSDFSDTGPGALIIFYFILTLALFATLFIFRTLIHKLPLKSAGLDLENAGKELGQGLLLGILLITAGFLALLALGKVEILSFNFVIGSFLGWLVFFTVQPFMEELLFRGYLMTMLGRYFGPVVALVVSSLLFGLVHAANANFNWLGFLSILLSGVLMGLLFLKTGRIWAATGLHITWNFFQGVVYGFNTSGITTYHVLDIQTTGTDWLSGGAFGFEGSILAVLFLIIAVIYYRSFLNDEKLSSLLEIPAGPAPVMEDDHSQIPDQ